MQSVLDTALAYLKQGISVVAADPKTKRPLFKWTEFQKTLPTEAQVRAMFQKFPNAMLSIITGELSHIMVVDTDSPEATQQVEDAFPDYFEAVVAISPRGGRHYYFTCANGRWQTKSAVLKNIDVRANGGVIVAPPSRNDSGGQYRWLTDLHFEKSKLQEMPGSLCALLKSAQVEHKPKFVVDLKTVEDLFEEGRRDSDLFHLALALRKSGESREYVLQVLIKFTEKWKENNDLKYLNEKAASAFQHEEKKERNWIDEIKDWVSSTIGYFNIKNCYEDMQAQTKEQKAIIRVNLGRLVTEKVIEKDKELNGRYRKVDNSLEKIDWESASDEHLDIRLPLDVTNYCNINPSNILVIAGCKDAGKSAFCLNAAILNLHKYKINYYSNEMGDVEIKRRLKKAMIHLNVTTESLRKINFYKRLDNFADVLEDEENLIHIIDYVDVTKDAFLIGETIKTIFAKLKHSVCLIALQKDYGKDLARGGASSLDKARIYVTLERGKAKIVSGKDWVNEHINPAGLEMSYKLVQGCKFISEKEWE